MIDLNRIKSNVKEFSFPRLSGTSGEQKAFELIKNKIKDLNLTPKIQEFEYSPFYSEIYPKISFFLIHILFWIYFFNINSIIILITTNFIILILIYLLILTRIPENIKIPKRNLLKSKNIIVNLNSADFYQYKESIFFLAHVDSKSQKYPTRIRILIYKLYFLTNCTLIFIIMMKIFFIINQNNYIKFIFNLIGFIGLFFNFFLLIIIILNKNSNNSNGSIDNASGIAIILELLNYIKKNPTLGKKCNYIFVFTGAEERGTMGARYLYKKYMKNFDTRKLIIFNFDAIAKKPDITFKKKNIKKFTDFYSIINEELKQNGFKLRIIRRPFGVHTDLSYLIFNKKLSVRAIGFGDLYAYKYLHSSNDSYDKIDFYILEKITKIVIKIIKNILLMIKNEEVRDK
ncbi:MAG: M28 family peptidase [Promethearchaeia archaeon]